MSTLGGSVPALVRGSLADRPVPRLVGYLCARSVTGRLALLDDDSGARTTVFFRSGFPVFVESPGFEDRLDRVLIETGMLDDRQVVEAELERGRSGKRLGVVLEEMGVLDHSIVAAALRRQLERKLGRALALRRGTFEVFVHDHLYGLGEELEAIQVDPLALPYPGIAEEYEKARQRSTGSMRAEGATPLPTVEADAAETDLVAEMIEEPAPVEEPASIARSPAPPPFSRRMTKLPDPEPVRITPPPRPVAAPATPPADLDNEFASPQHTSGSRQFAVTKTTEFAPPPALAQTPPAPADAQAKATPAAGVAVIGAPQKARTAAKPATPLEFKERILDLEKRIAKMTLFEMLGLQQDARGAEVEAAYLRQVQVYHPDRLAALGLSSLRPRVEALMVRMGEARVILSDEAKRGRYLASLQYSDEDRDAAQKALDAEMRFQEGEAFLKQRNFAKAEEAYQKAVELNALEPEHQALLAWARFQNPRGNRDLMAREGIKALRAVLVERSGWGRGYYFIGCFFKHAGETDKAARAFEAAIKADRTLVDAARELRLLESRMAGGKRR